MYKLTLVISALSILCSFNVFMRKINRRSRSLARCALFSILGLTRFTIRVQHQVSAEKIIVQRLRWHFIVCSVAMRAWWKHLFRTFKNLASWSDYPDCLGILKRRSSAANIMLLCDSWRLIVNGVMDTEVHAQTSACTALQFRQSRSQRPRSFWSAPVSTNHEGSHFFNIK